MSQAAIEKTQDTNLFFSPNFVPSLSESGAYSWCLHHQLQLFISPVA